MLWTSTQVAPEKRMFVLKCKVGSAPSDDGSMQLKGQHALVDKIKWKDERDWQMRLSLSL